MPCSFLKVAENLAQLMFSVLMTGYMFKNAEYRLELQQSLEQVALIETTKTKVSPDLRSKIIALINEIETQVSISTG